VKETPREARPAGVTERSKQAGEAPTRWAWVERAAWTERMLAALETGVKGGKWFSLMDKVYAARNLQAAWEKVRQNQGAAGTDGQSVGDFGARADQELTRLAGELRQGVYEPQPVKRVHIPKPGSQEQRPLGIPSVRDRVVQTALRNVLEPIFEKKFAPRSYGFRPGRGCKDALRRVQELLDEGYTWVVDADIQKYFDTIPHEPLLAEVEQEVADGRVLELLCAYLKQGVLDGLETWEPEAGTPQGAVISPLLANIYLHPVDVELAAAGYEMLRYADDFVILCRSEAEAQAALELVQRAIEGRGLALHPEKTRVVNTQERDGFDFLGYHFERGYRWPRKKSLKKLKDAIRAKTKRTNGNSLAVIITEVNQTLRGWFGYFKHSYKTAFPPLDRWVRMRLRSILRKRRKGQGRGRGTDHQRWPNAFFQEQGLFTMTEARRALCRS
jgi:RNA-directed DNA polymerase